MKRVTWMTLLSFVSCLAAAAVLAIVPIYTSGSDSRPSKSLIEVNGTWSVVLMLIPVAVALVPVLFPARPFRLIAATLLSAFTLVGTFTIGLFYLPASILMLIAASARGASS